LTVRAVDKEDPVSVQAHLANRLQTGEPDTVMPVACGVNTPTDPHDSFVD
jgi:hypothetical protein